MDKLQTDLNEFNKLHPNRKLAVMGIILFVFILSILVGVYFTKSGSQTETGATPTPTGTATEKATTSLSLVPSASAVKVGDMVKVSVMLDGESVQATDVVVKYDPTLFEASAVVNGTIYESIVREEIKDGMVSVTSAVSPTAVDNLKTGELFSFSLKALKAGAAELSFDPELTITAKNGLNTLKATQSVSVTIQ